MRCSWNARKAASVATSKNVNSGASSITRPSSRTSVGSSIGVPSTWIRSAKRFMCGEVYRPTRLPEARPIEATSAQTLPLPLVPATWTDSKERSGLPMRAHAAAIRSVPS